MKRNNLGDPFLAFVLVALVVAGSIAIIYALSS